MTLFGPFSMGSANLARICYVFKLDHIQRSCTKEWNISKYQSTQRKAYTKQFHLIDRSSSMSLSSALNTMNDFMASNILLLIQSLTLSFVRSSCRSRWVLLVCCYQWWYLWKGGECSVVGDEKCYDNCWETLSDVVWKPSHNGLVEWYMVDLKSCKAPLHLSSQHH